jgi:hypothetical protein
MATMPPGLIFCDAAGLVRARSGSATVWIRDMFAPLGSEWISQKGSIYLRPELDANGHRVAVPIFRDYASPLADEPLSKFDGFTQP